jgi:hypothetical protein
VGYSGDKGRERGREVSKEDNASKIERKNISMGSTPVLVYQGPASSSGTILQEKQK